MFKKCLLLSFFLTTFFGLAKAQTFSENNVGATIGLNLAVGSPVNRLGVHISAYYVHDHLQISLTSNVFHNFSSFGPKVASNEAKLSLGLTGAFGSENDTRSEFINPVSNQTVYDLSLGYAYSIILASNGTSQPTGMIGFNYGKLLLVHENDILAGTGDDKFRTGGLLAAYEDGDRRYGLNYMGWTGDPRSEGAVKVKDSDYPAKHGYKDLRDALYGKFSHGILAAEVSQTLEYGQLARLQLGVDAEQIRNVMQNKLMHERITGGYHYPMLKENGEPYLYNEESEVRKTKGYFELMLNPTLFY